MTKTLLKRTVSIVLSALLLMSVFSITTFAEEVIGYGVWVGDTEVTSLNCEDIPSVMGGKAYYDAETSTLTLDNVSDIRGESYNALIFSRNNLNIELIGYSSPSADYDGVHRYTGIYCLKNLTINSKNVAGLVLQGVTQVVEVYGSFTLNNGVIDAMILPPQEDSYGLFNPIGIRADTVRINGGHIFLEKMRSSAFVDEEIGIYADNIYITGGTTILSRFREGMTASNIAITGGRIEIIEGRNGIYATDSFEVSGNNTELYINTYGTDSKAVLAYSNSPFTVGEDVEIVYPGDAKLGYAYGDWPTFTDKDGNVLQEVHIKTKTVQVKWYNEDGTLLYESPCNVNTKPEYHGPTPEKESTDTTYFVFKGWTPELEPIKADESYTAQFEEKDRTIKVKLQLPSGETEEVELDVYSNVEKVLNKVIEDNDLEAEDTFMTLPDDSLRIHPEESLYRLQVGDGDTLILHHRVNVIWMNGDGKVLDSKSYMSDREEPKTNKTPTKDEDEKYTYEFDKWDDGEYNGHTKVYTPVWTKTEKPTEPVTDVSTEPETTELVTDAPTESFTAEPTQPATIEPTGNIIVDPTEPSTVEPTQPATVEPTESIIVDPTVPATVEPTAPEVTEPVDTTPVATNPEETTPTVPVDTTPVVTDPIITEPVVTNPITTDPVVTEPFTPPAATDPTQPPVVKPDESKTKKANPMTVEIKKKTVKAKKLKKKAQKIKAITVKNNVGKVTYKLVKKGITKKIRKLVKINKKGVITIKKWKKAKKGNYKIKVKITAKGNASYNAKTIIKVIKVKIK